MNGKDAANGRRAAWPPWLYAAIIGMALLAGVLLRFWRLEADPPSFLSIATTDEGIWAFSARNKLIEGCWNCGANSPNNLAFYTAPLYSFFSYLSMRAGGLTLWTIRFPAALAGSLTLILFWLYLRRAWDAQRAAVATVWFCLCQFHVAHSRVGLVETTLLLAEMLVWGCLYIPGRTAATVAGLLFGASFLIKHVAAQDLPALALIFLAGWAAGRRRATDAFYFVAGPFTLLLGYFPLGGVSWSQWTRTTKVMTEWGFTASGLPAFFSNPALLWMFWPVLGTLVYLLTLRLSEGHSGWRSFCRERTMEAYAAAVVAGNAVGIMVNTYQAERRFLVLAPAAIVLATAAWKELSGAQARRPVLGIASACAACFLVVRLAMSGAGVYMEIFRRSVFNPPLHFWFMQLLAAIALAVIFRKTRLTPLLASTALTAALLTELALLGTWLTRPSYDLKSSFTEVASLPYSGALLTDTESCSIAVGFQGCVRLFGPRVADGHVDSSFLYHLRRERRKLDTFTTEADVEYRTMLPFFPFVPPGSRLVRSFTAVAGFNGRPPRQRDWLWINPGPLPGVSRQRCCSPP